ncbi:Uu.00g089330.m01.CDS01 [Anthostomella pinea]|uniref:Uu.00g089330.m01.CDS01 n=1 Tax=Anthostomella pinea TaxID=933095 RepID=A0AAI8VNA9_9PEZI|nr:Uu.00g089330.m01.CDS01 [Anthostomella pinea]
MPNPEPRAGLALHPGFYIAAWIFFSNITILFNKWLIDNAGFRYPVILTWWHMTFATLATQVLALTTSLLDGRHDIKMTRTLYCRAVVPIGLLYSGSMIFSTLVYLYLSVPFIQMLKQADHLFHQAAAPVVTLFIGWLWGVEHPTWSKVLYILLIVAGVVMASAGEVHFSWPGFVYQVGGIVFESLRVIMIQHLVSDAGLKMDPLVSLYYYAPVCAITNLVVSVACGWSSFEWTHAVEVGFWMLLLNAVVAFMLNVSSVLLIGKTSSLVLVLTGILKNILLVAAAVVIWGTSIASIQLVGYGLALGGLVLYQSSWQELQANYNASIQWARDRSTTRGTREIRFPPFARKPLIVVVSVVASSLLVLAWTRRTQSYGMSISVTGVVNESDRLSKGWLTWIHVRDGKWWIGTG